MADPLGHRELTLTETALLLWDGLKISLSPGCRLYIIIPICVNFVVLALASWLLVWRLTNLISALTGELPGFLEVLVALILSLAMLFASCYIFTTLATIIASPFYGLLAERVEKMLTGRAPNDDTLWMVIKDIPRVLKRELQKQLFFLPRALLCLIVMVIPAVNIVSPVLWFLLGAWMGCIQYCDYAYDNNKIAFKEMRRDLGEHRLQTFLFGGVIMLLLSVPLLNLLVPPSAVCAGTKYYLKMQQTYSIAGGD